MFLQVFLQFFKKSKSTLAKKLTLNLSLVKSLQTFNFWINFCVNLFFGTTIKFISVRKKVVEVILRILSPFFSRTPLVTHFIIHKDATAHNLIAWLHPDYCFQVIFWYIIDPACKYFAYCSNIVAYYSKVQVYWLSLSKHNLQIQLRTKNWSKKANHTRFWQQQEQQQQQQQNKKKKEEKNKLKKTVNWNCSHSVAYVSFFPV